MQRHRPVQDGEEARPDRGTRDPIPPLKTILTEPVVLSIANNLMLCFFDFAFRALQPLFFATPIRLGGLGLSPATIGLCLGILGPLDAVAQGLLFTKILRRLGLRRLFLTSIFCFVPLTTTLPVINHFAREWGVSPGIWALIVLQCMFNCVTEMAYGECALLHSCRPPVTSIQAACSYTSPPRRKIPELSGLFMGSDKRRRRSLERWDQRCQHLCFRTRYKKIG